MNCPTHDMPYVEEPGGPEWPSLNGRTYCPGCQLDFIAALDQQVDREVVVFDLHEREP